MTNLWSSCVSLPSAGTAVQTWYLICKQVFSRKAQCDALPELVHPDDTVQSVKDSYPCKTLCCIKAFSSCFSYATQRVRGAMWGPLWENNSTIKECDAFFKSTVCPLKELKFIAEVTEYIQKWNVDCVEHQRLLLKAAMIALENMLTRVNGDHVLVTDTRFSRFFCVIKKLWFSLKMYFIFRRYRFVVVNIGYKVTWI